MAHREGLARSIDASGLRIVVDCANGSASAVAARILRATGASVEVINDQPDGLNINLHCGATDQNFPVCGFREGSYIQPEISRPSKLFHVISFGSTKLCGLIPPVSLCVQRSSFARLNVDGINV